jgi:primosomal protein N' (replication factor Y) (superfamily II helicase)
MNRTFADIIIISSEKQKGSDSPYTYHADFQLYAGDIVYVPLGPQTVIGVVISNSQLPPAFTTRPIISPTPFRITTYQIDLAQWLARHYHTTLATMLGVFVTNAVVPTPVRQWQLTEAGLHASMSDLPADERGILYVMREYHVLNEKDLLTKITIDRTKLTPLRKWLVARGYVNVSYRVDLPKVVMPTIKVVRYVTDVGRLNTAQQRVVDELRSSPNQQLPVSHFKNKALIKRLIDHKICEMIEVEPSLAPLGQAVQLSESQRTVVDQVSQSFAQHHTFLLDGVTGSGKTEIYFALIDQCLNAGKQVLVLAPEIALTTQLAERFAKRFPGRVGVIHGQITPTQRRLHWLQSLKQQLPIIIGPRSALYVPQPNIGLIIVDEEHDTSYKSEFAPFINARDAAIMYGKFANIPVVLGSATPSVELVYAGLHDKVTHLQLPHRIDTTGESLSLPPVRIIDMRNEPCIDTSGLIGQTLAEELRLTLSQHNQVLLLLNRRGNTGARICRACGAVARCHRCSTPMAIHYKGALHISICHTCGAQRHPETHCLECFNVDFIEYGSGTQRVVEIVRTHYPDIDVIQWDRDTADSAHDHIELLNRAQAQPQSVIVGTQMIAKGLDLPHIRLVGVINTDIALHLPDFRAAERTYQLLTQVAGRAGRRQGDAHVILQSFQPDNYAIQAAARYQSSQFYAQELAYREHLGYPPFQRMAKLIWQHQNAQQCEHRAITESHSIQEIITRESLEARLIGPTPAFFSRIRGQYRWQVIVLARNLRKTLTSIDNVHHAIVDVDPISLL